MAQTEIWKWVEGFPDYSISNQGQVRRKSRIYSRYNDVKITGGGYLSLHDNRGYKEVFLYKNDGTKKATKHFVHRLVAKHFISNDLNKPFVNHLDCDKSNNNYYNLEWCTQKENQRHAVANNRYNPGFGENHASSKLNESDIIGIKEKIASGMQQRKIGKMYNISQAVISKINTNQSWNHIK